ncbi:YjcZ family sporulation protein, partial [Bacillus cereus]
VLFILLIIVGAACFC